MRAMVQSRAIFGRGKVPKETSDEAMQSTAGPRKPVFTKKLSFILAVVVPSVLAALYISAIMSDQFVVETRLVVRTIGISEQYDDADDRTGRAVIGGDSLTQDAYIFANFVESIEMARALEHRIDLKDRFSRKSIDPLSRLSAHASLEELHSFWRGQIDTYVDGPSGIIVLEIRAFSAEDALLISEEAIKVGSEMLDALSERAKSNVVLRAEEELQESVEEFTTALNEFEALQSETGVFDPRSDAIVATQAISALNEQKLEAELRLAVLRDNGITQSPQVDRQRSLIGALHTEINKLRAQLASDGNVDQSLAQKAALLARSQTKKLVAEALYKSSTRNLDSAKSTALRRTTFVTAFVPPAAPQESRYPDRLSTWFVFYLLLFAFWSVVTLTWMSVEDHRT